mmetsp:Transcript_134716/g.430395  ORF Transcript_134716/g.430395 Transcript_134716/m.430395 type:complete len:92 (-) Transcript_134716:190-465(-)
MRRELEDCVYARRADRARLWLLCGEPSPKWMTLFLEAVKFCFVHLQPGMISWMCCDPLCCGCQSTHRVVEPLEVSSMHATSTTSVGGVDAR